MLHKPSTNQTYFLVIVFVCALLFFGITRQVAKDVSNARLEDGKKTLTKHITESMTKVVENIVPKKITDIVTPSRPEGIFTYLEVTDSCGVHFGGECLRVRSGPGTDFPVVASLRNGMVLKVSETITKDGVTWHKVIFDEWLRYPERHNGNWYVAADYVTLVSDPGTMTLATHPKEASSTKSILVDRSEQKLYAYEGDELFLAATSSTGLDFTPTPRGVFSIFQKTPSRYMQGPLPNISDDYYDLPGVPWTMYFTEGGAAIHGAYWHDKFGTKHSHGCVNLEPTIAHKLYDWANLGTTVTVRD